MQKLDLSLVYAYTPHQRKMRDYENESISGFYRDAEADKKTPVTSRPDLVKQRNGE